MAKESQSITDGKVNQSMADTDSLNETTKQQEYGPFLFYHFLLINRILFAYFHQLSP